MNAMIGYCYQTFGRGIWHMGGYWMGLIFILGILILFLAGYFLIKKQNVTGVKESPIDILKKQYASGLISREEFNMKKKDLV